MDGVITQQDVVPSDESGKSVLSIKGEDLTRMMDVIDLSGFPYPAMPAEARVAAHGRQVHRRSTRSSRWSCRAS